MSENSETREAIELLQEIRNTLAAIAAKQAQALEFTRQEAQDTRERIAESLKLQRLAMARQKKALVIGLLLLLPCFASLGYLLPHL